MESSETAKKINYKRLALLIAIVLLFAFLIGIVFRLRYQRTKLRELNEQTRQLEDRVNELMREKERLQSDLEFTKSLEGLLQYARDNLGYKLPEDIRIEDDMPEDGGTDGE